MMVVCIIIGVKCVSGSSAGSETIAGQIELLVMQKTDYDIPEDVGILLGKNVDVGILDYSNPMRQIMQGYNETIEKMDYIKSRIKREAPREDVIRRRMKYKSSLPSLNFSKNSVDMLNKINVKSSRRDIQSDTLYVNTDNKVDLEVNDYSYTFEQLKAIYYRAVLDRNMKPNFPKAVYNPKTGLFDLSVKMTSVPIFKIQGGLNISSSSINQAYLGAIYQDNRSIRGVYSLDGYLGSFYSSTQLTTRHTNYNKRIPYFIENTLTYNYTDYARANNQSINFNAGSNEASYSSSEFYYSATVGVKMMKDSRAVIRGAVGQNRLKFSDKIITNDILIDDIGDVGYLNIGVQLDDNSLNYESFPTRGRNMILSGSLTYARTKITEPAYDETQSSRVIYESGEQWFGVSYKFEQYHNVNKYVSFGYLVSGVYTNMPDLGSDYINRALAPRFAPTEFSKTLFLPEFQESSFIGAGFMPIIEYNDNIYIKGGLFVYKPDILKYESGFIDEIKYMTTVAAVYRSPLGPISLSYNNFSISSTKRNYFIFSFGYMLFNNRGIVY